MLHHSTAIAVILVSTISLSPQDDVKALTGNWLVASAELSGEALPEKATSTMRLNIAGDKYAFTEGKSLDRGDLKIDATKKPKEMDIIGVEGPNKGKTYLAIYELKGDTLRICYDLGGKSRPSEFATKKGAALFLVTYQRMK
jgi:uncharacterized protein (TIGR03067 family)